MKSGSRTDIGLDHSRISVIATSLLAKQWDGEATEEASGGWFSS